MFVFIIFKLASVEMFKQIQQDLGIIFWIIYPNLGFE